MTSIRIHFFLLAILLCTAVGQAQRVKALRFYAPTSSVVIANHDDFTFTDDFTIEAWVYVIDHPRQFNNIIEKTDAVYGICITQQGFANAYISTASAYAEALSQQPIPRNEWHHIAMMYDGNSGLISLWVDGKANGSGLLSPKGPLPKTTGNLVIGGTTVNSGRFNGYIDEVRLSKVYRYKSEFDPRGSYTNDVNTVGLYHFDEGTGTTSADASAKKHDATLTDVQWVSVPLGVGRPPVASANDIALEQNYPNPIRTSSTIKVTVASGSSAQASLVLFDVLGRKVADLSHLIRSGESTIALDRSLFPFSGQYVLTLRSGSNAVSRVMSVMK